MPALFKRTGGEDFPDRLKCMITGPAKSGKTTLLGTVPNIIIADTEPDANNLQSIAHLNLPYHTIRSSNDLQQLLFVLRDDSLRAKAAEQLGMPLIEAVGLDTLDTLQQILKAERMREQRTSKFLRDDWNWLKDEMSQIIKAFTALPLHVFIVVHTKTAELGSGDDARSIVLPGLQGAIAEDIAGMVGYSLLAFRKQEIRPDGSPYTKYWLRAEGDETYNYLGNRTAGRLPDVIEPNFKILFDAATAGRARVQTPAQILDSDDPALQAATTQAPLAAGQAAQVAAPAAQQVAQTSGQSQPGAPPVGQPAQPTAQSAGAPPAASPAADATQADSEPVNVAALTVTKKVFDACGLEFPEEKIRALSLGDARSLVRMWQAIQKDAVENKLQNAPADEMTSYLANMNYLAPADDQRWRAEQAAGTDPAPVPTAPEAKPEISPDIAGTIEQVMAYVGEDLRRAQEAYDLEVVKPKARATLINALISKGVTVSTAVQNETASPAEPNPPAPATQVTPAPAGAEGAATDEQVDEANATALLAENLGAVPIDDQGTPMPCEECGSEVDDEDIARLSVARFKRRLCVGDYIAETKKPRQPA